MKFHTSRVLHSMTFYPNPCKSKNVMPQNEICSVWITNQIMLLCCSSLSPYPSVLDFWIIKFEKSSSTCKNQFWNWFFQATQAVKLDFSEIKYRSTGDLALLQHIHIQLKVHLHQGCVVNYCQIAWILLLVLSLTTNSHLISCH